MQAFAHKRIEPLKSDKVFLAPSGVQKERILAEHIFVLPYPQPSPHTDRIFLRRPATNLKYLSPTQIINALVR